MPFSETFEFHPQPRKTVPPGRGFGLRIDAITRQTYSTGTEAMRVTFLVVTAPPGCEATVGTTVTESFALTDKAFWLIAPLLAALDVKPDASGAVRFEADNLVGRTVVADFVSETFEGEVRIRVRKFRKA